MKQSTRFIGLMLISGFCVAAILYFGLKPKGMKFHNQVEWLDAENGIRIGKYGLAYTDQPDGLSQINAGKGFTLEFAVRATSDTGGFKSLLMMDSGSAETQLIVGQWKSAIIAMNGNDYDNRRRTKKLVAMRALIPGREHLFTITTSEAGGAHLFIDGTLAVKRLDMNLNIPLSQDSFHFVIGNSVYGRHSWHGHVSGVAVYGRKLDAQRVDAHFRAWKQDRNFGFADDDQPVLLYLFDEGRGDRVMDHSGSHNPLVIPSRAVILKKEFLGTPARQYLLNASNIADVALNIAGFVPLGAVLFLLFRLRNPSRDKYNAGVVIGICMLMSLFIETAQVWMPSRGSSLLDLISNTFGGAMGVVACLVGYYGLNSSGRTDRRRTT